MTTCLKCNKPVDRIFTCDNTHNIEEYFAYVSCHGKIERFRFLRSIGVWELKYAFSEKNDRT